MGDLPTTFYGIPEDDDDTKSVQDALQAITATINSVSPHLMPRLISSVLLTVCANQLDPIAAFEAIGEQVGQGIAAHLAKPEGSA